MIGLLLLFSTLVFEIVFLTEPRARPASPQTLGILLSSVSCLLSSWIERGYFRAQHFTRVLESQTQVLVCTQQAFD